MCGGWSLWRRSRGQSQLRYFELAGVAKFGSLAFGCKLYRVVQFRKRRLSVTWSLIMLIMMMMMINAVLGKKVFVVHINQRRNASFLMFFKRKGFSVDRPRALNEFVYA